MIGTEQKHYTAEDYKKLEEGDPHQLVNGELVALGEPAPTYGHQEISLDIAVQIRTFLKKNPIGKVICAPFDVYFEENNVLQPDIVYVSDKIIHLIQDDGIHGAPDMIIEILSPTTCYYDTKTKKEIYEKCGVKEYWLVDPADEEVIGFENINGKFQELFRGHGKFLSKLLNLEVSLKL